MVGFQRRTLRRLQQAGELKLGLFFQMIGHLVISDVLQPEETSGIDQRSKSRLRTMGHHRLTVS